MPNDAKPTDPTPADPTPADPTPTGPTPADGVPATVFFFVNGTAAVVNAAGDQLPQFQGDHLHAVRALAYEGYPWWHLPEVFGVPRVSAGLQPALHVAERDALANEARRLRGPAEAD